MAAEPILDELAGLMGGADLVGQLGDIEIFGDAADHRAGGGTEGEDVVAVEEGLGGQVYALEGADPPLEDIQGRLGQRLTAEDGPLEIEEVAEIRTDQKAFERGQAHAGVEQSAAMFEQPGQMACVVAAELEKFALRQGRVDRGLGEKGRQGQGKADPTTQGRKDGDAVVGVGGIEAGENGGEQRELSTSSRRRRRGPGG